MQSKLVYDLMHVTLSVIQCLKLVTFVFCCLISSFVIHRFWASSFASLLTPFSR